MCVHATLSSFELLAIDVGSAPFVAELQVEAVPRLALGTRGEVKVLYPDAPGMLDDLLVQPGTDPPPFVIGMRCHILHEAETAHELPFRHERRHCHDAVAVAARRVEIGDHEEMALDGHLEKIRRTHARRMVGKAPEKNADIPDVVIGDT